MSANEPTIAALVKVVERRREDAVFKKRLLQIIEQDRELLERLAK